MALALKYLTLGPKISDETSLAHKDAAERGRGKAVADVAEVEGVCAVVAGGWWIKCLTGPVVVLGSAAVEKSGGTQFTCFTGTKVHILTPEARRCRGWCSGV